MTNQSDQTAITPAQRSPLARMLDDEGVRRVFTNALGNLDGGAFIASIITATRNNPTLQECAPVSIVTAAMGVASLGLSLDAQLGQAALVPFNSKNGMTATHIIMWRGLQQLAIRTGQYRVAPRVFPIYEGETVEEDRITGEVKISGKKTSQKKIAWGGYYETVNGMKGYDVMTVEEIHAHARRYSPGYSNPKGYWTKDPEAMEKKTVIRRLLKSAPMSHRAELSAMTRDGDEDVIDAEATEQGARLAELAARADSGSETVTGEVVTAQDKINEMY